MSSFFFDVRQYDVLAINELSALLRSKTVSVRTYKYDCLLFIFTDLVLVTATVSSIGSESKEATPSTAHDTTSQSTRDDRPETSNKGVTTLSTIHKGMLIEQKSITNQPVSVIAIL